MTTIRKAIARFSFDFFFISFWSLLWAMEQYRIFLIISRIISSVVTLWFVCCMRYLSMDLCFHLFIICPTARFGLSFSPLPFSRTSATFSEYTVCPIQIRMSSLHRFYSATWIAHFELSKVWRKSIKWKNDNMNFTLVTKRIWMDGWIDIRVICNEMKPK